MTAAVSEQNTYPKITPADLKDPTLFRLQTMFDFLYSQIDQTQNSVSTLSKTVSTASAVSPVVADDTGVTLNGIQVMY